MPPCTNAARHGTGELKGVRASDQARGVAAESAAYNSAVHALNLKRAALDNLVRTGNALGRKTLLVMDESSMTGAADAARIAGLASAIGARVVFQGDIKQHGSVPAGRAFLQAQQAGMNTARLQETRRFDKATEQVKTALEAIGRGDFSRAVSALDRSEVAEAQLPQAVAIRYLRNVRELQARGLTKPKVGIVAVTNEDRKAINSAVHDVLAEAGLVDRASVRKEHLNDLRLTEAQRANAGMLAAAGVNRLAFRKSYREAKVKKGEVLKVQRFDIAGNRIHALNEAGQAVVINPVQQDYFTPAIGEVRMYSAGDNVEARAVMKFDDRATPAVANGMRGVIERIDDAGASVRWGDGRRTVLDNQALRFVDLAYAHTSFKEQGATHDREIVALSAQGAQVFNKESDYVSLTRAKDNTEIVTSDWSMVLRNAGAEVSKSTALEEGGVARAVEGVRRRMDLAAHELSSRGAELNGAQTEGGSLELMVR